MADRKEAPTLAVLTFQGEKMNCNEVTEIAIGQDKNGDERLAVAEVDDSWNSCSSPDKLGSVHLRTQEEVLEFAGTVRVEGDLLSLYL